MYPLILVEAAAAPSPKPTDPPKPAGKVPGLEYLVPKPELHGYAWTLGEE